MNPAKVKSHSQRQDARHLRLALRLAQRGYGLTSPNPMVGAVLVKSGRIIGRGWHRRAGGPHAEIETLRDAQARGHSPRGATLYVTLEPCSTQGHTPPCTGALIAAGIRRVVAGAMDPNPKHAGKGFQILKRAGIAVESFDYPRSSGVRERSPQSCRLGDLTRRLGGEKTGSRAELQTIAEQCARLNEAFNHWIVHRTPFVTVKAGMTLDGKIATASGESKWITGERARAHGMKLRQRADAILVGVNTILADDPSLTVRGRRPEAGGQGTERPLRRIVLDAMARTPLTAKIVRDAHAALTTIVVSKFAPKNRVAALAKRVKVLGAPIDRHAPRTTNRAPRIDLRWLLKKLGVGNVTNLLVEGGGEVNASFLLGGFAHRVAFFYAPKILGGRNARKGVAGDGARSWNEILHLCDLEWRRLGPDLLLTARLESKL